MKQFKAFFISGFFLLALTSLPVLSAADPTCDSNPAVMPDDIAMTIVANYVGRASNNRPVFYNVHKKIVYVFEENFAGEPIILPWNQSTDKRYVQALNNWNLLLSDGARPFLTSLHVRCSSSTQFDSNSPNKNGLNYNSATACIEPENGISTSRTSKCCPSLTLNLNTFKCDEPSYIDLSIKTCANNSHCSDGQGCFPQRPTDLFSGHDTGNGLQDVIDEQVDGTLDSGKADNAACTHAKQCSSYSCIDGSCKRTLICRYADETEFAPGNIKCSDEMEKDAQSRCTKGPGHTPYIGMLDEINFIENGQCSFSIRVEDKVMAEAALKSLRAMEWVLGAISQNEPGDCFKLASHLRDNVAQPMIERRREILKNYNREIGAIEADYRKLETAAEGSTAPVQIHGVSQVFARTLTENDLFTRNRSGYDSLMLMYRRNALFQEYERSMLQVVNDANEVMFALSQAMESWEDDDKSWDLGGEDNLIQKFNCDATYDKLTWKGWRQRRYDKIRNRWSTYFEVDGTQPDNKHIIKRAKLNDFLAILHQVTPDDVTALYSETHLLLDPLLVGGKNTLAMDQFGTNKNLRQYGIGGTVVNLWNRTRPNRKARYLKDRTTGSYRAIHTAFKKEIEEHYKTMNISSQDKFIYEPELAGFEAKDCAISPEGAHCETYRNFIDELTDYSFAQFLTYSYRGVKEHYKNYFNNPDEGRSMLISKYVVDLSNLGLYYNKLIEKREQQNTCITNALNHVVDNYLDDSSGIGEGNYFNPGGQGQATAASDRSVTALKLTPQSRARFHPVLLDANKSFSDKKFGEAGSGSQGGATRVADASNVSSAIAARIKAMKESNSRAATQGVDVAGKEARVKSLITGLQNTGAGSGAASTGAPAASSASGNKAKIDDDKEAEVPSVTAAGTDVGNFSAGGNAGIGGFGSYNDGNSSSGSHDSTGMSNEEKNILMENLARNKSEYDPNEGDGLFHILSKAYIRNLDKVLTRKKEGK